MVAPFKPYSKSIRLDWVGSTQARYILYALGTNQVPPYVNTAYTCSITGSNTANYSWGNNVYSDEVRIQSRQIAINKAKAKMMAELGDTSSIGATLTAERRETYGMLKSGILTIFSSARALKRGDLVKAARLLGVAPPERTIVSIRRTRNGKGRRITSRRKVLVLPNGRQVAHSLGNKWLWWSYGVKPLAIDVYNCADVLQREQPWKRIQGVGSGTYTNTLTDSSIWDNIIRTSNTGKSVCKMSIDVRIKNANLFLADQLGLTNPVQWINEAIMFSFVIDWFSNLSQVISQMTDFVGLETSDPLTAIKSSQTQVVTQSKSGVTPKIERYRIEYERSLTIPPAKLRFAYERFSWQRGANAISLLVQFLKKG